MKNKLFVLLLFVCILIIPCKAGAQETYKTYKLIIDEVYVNGGNSVKITFRGSDNTIWNDDIYDEDEGYYDYSSVIPPSEYEIYRSDSENGQYVLLAKNDATDSKKGLTYTDNSVAEGKTYYYKLRFLFEKNIYVDDDEDSYTKWVTFEGDFTSPLKVTAIQSPGKIKSVRSKKAKTFEVKWNAVSGVDGYEIYVKEFDNKYLDEMHYYSRYEVAGFNNDTDYGYGRTVPDEVEKIEFKKAATVSANKTTYTYKKAKHGYGYLFAIHTYKTVNGKKITSTVKYVAHGVMDYYFCPNAENTKFNYKWPKNQKQAWKMMKTIKVNMWDFKNHSAHKGAKKKRVQYITVNKKYAETIKMIYKDIYKSKSKPPIYEAGSYRWREGDLGSYHTVGVAIDMNCNENPMYSGYGKKKKIIVGSFYKPKSNPYSIPRNGVVEKTFEKYGFYRLTHDLMHFNAGYVSPSSNYNN